MPAVELDKQGRSRESLAELYNWRYKKLGNLPHVSTSPEYLTANPGFSFDFQVGWTTAPSPMSTLFCLDVLRGSQFQVISLR